MRSRILVLLLLLAFVLAVGQPTYAGEEEDPLLPDEGDEDIEKPDPGEEDPLNPDEGEKPGEEGDKPAEDPACKICTAKKMCDPHKEKEKETLGRLKDFLKKNGKKEKKREDEDKRAAQLIALLEEVAALTYEHPQYKSKNVADALGKALITDVNIEVRGKLLDLLDDRQREDVCLKYLQTYVLKKDHNTEAMKSAALAAIAYFQNPKLVGFLKGYFDNASWRIRLTSIDSIAYTGGHAGISALIGLLDECAREANKNWDEEGGASTPWRRINEYLKKLTNHTPDIDTSKIPNAMYVKYFAKDWKNWWRLNGRKYEKPEKTEQERKGWKYRVRAFKQDSPYPGGGGGGRGDDEGEGR